MSYNKTLTCATFNVGGGWRDYQYMVAADNYEMNKLKNKFGEVRSPEHLEELQNKQQNKVESLAAGRFANFDVLLLQEVYDNGRQFIKSLQDLGYKIFSLGANHSTAIALKTESFEDDVAEHHVVSQSNPQPIPYGQEIACVVAKVKDTGIPIALTSMHSWGFQLYRENYKGKKRLTERDINQANYGIAYTKEAIANIDTLQRAYSIVGGDFNNNRHNDPRQFELFDEAGFEEKAPDFVTNVNVNDYEYLHRTIDTIFGAPGPISTLSRIWTAVKSIFVSTIQYKLSDAMVHPDFSFTVKGNCSDHMPVVTTLTIETVPSKLSQMWNWIWSPTQEEYETIK